MTKKRRAFCRNCSSDKGAENSVSTANVNQLKIVVFSIILGLIFGFLYDMIDTCRTVDIRRMFWIKKSIVRDGEQKKKRSASPAFFANILWDTVFMTAAGILYSLFVYEACYGDFRWFSLVGTGIGFLLYRVTVGRLTRVLIRFLSRAVSAVLRVTLVLPIYFLLRCLKRTSMFVWHTTVGPFIRVLSETVGRMRTERAKRSLPATVRFSRENQ